jgi:hypothetical protein
MSTESTGKGDGMSGEAGDRTVLVMLVICAGIVAYLLYTGAA